MLTLENIRKTFPGPSPGVRVHALAGVSLAVAPGETVAVVGESGSGKSTLGRVALRLEAPSNGTVLFDGRDITRASERTLRPLRARMQMVFQDPWGTLNPRMRVRSLLEEPYLLHARLPRAERRARVVDLAARVRLNAAQLDRYPAQLSGGQLQRVAIARALATSPRLVVLDEPTSSLDLSVRAEVLALLAELQREFGVGYLFISHDLATVGLIADRLAVMYLGRVVETGPAARVFARPLHPYTQALFSAQLSTDPAVKPSRVTLRGEPPSPLQEFEGCGFAARCPVAMPACRTAPVPVSEPEPGHSAACLRVADGTSRTD